jgi:hypothetical protein
VVNHLSPVVRIVAASSGTGRISASGSTVTWTSFQLGAGQSASASIQVAFTPTQAEVSSAIPLSTGITADAVDVTTGQRFTLSYGPLATKAQVQAAKGVPSQAVRPSTTTAGRGGVQTAPSLSGLPASGGAAFRRAGFIRSSRRTRAS